MVKLVLCLFFFFSFFTILFSPHFYYSISSSKSLNLLFPLEPCFWVVLCCFLWVLVRCWNLFSFIAENCSEYYCWGFTCIEWRQMPLSEMVDFGVYMCWYICLWKGPIINDLGSLSSVQATFRHNLISPILKLLITCSFLQGVLCFCLFFSPSLGTYVCLELC